MYERCPGRATRWRRQPAGGIKQNARCTRGCPLLTLFGVRVPRRTMGARSVRAPKRRLHCPWHWPVRQRGAPCSGEECEWTRMPAAAATCCGGQATAHVQPPPRSDGHPRGFVCDAKLSQKKKTAKSHECRLPPRPGRKARDPLCTLLRQRRMDTGRADSWAGACPHAHPSYTE